MEKKQKTIHELMDESLAKGWKMSKQISSGSYGFFSNTEPTYDNRTIYTREELFKLSKEGFGLETNMAWIVFNVLMNL